MRPAAIAILLVGALSATGILAMMVSTALRGAPPAQLLAWDDPGTVARGAMLYERDCRICHGGLDGRAAAGETPAPVAPPHDETGHSWEHPDYVLFSLTKTGEVAELCLTGGASGAEMPEFAEQLTDRQILDVLSYIKSTWPEEVRARQDGVNEIYAAQNAATRAILEEAGAL